MKIFFSAGEPSGDQHAARLIDALRSHHAEIETEGFAGPACRAAGCRLLFELTELAVMGFLRVLPLLRQFRRLVRQAEQHFDRDPPDAVILVDFPGFNWWIARAAKKRGIPVLYYLPPQLWAWAPWRIRKIRRFVDHVICALPFEYEWYRERGISCSLAGHPFFDHVRRTVLKEELVRNLRGQTEKPEADRRHGSDEGPQQLVAALLPGSRNHEIERNWQLILEAVARTDSTVSDVRWIAGCYREEHLQRCRELQREAGCEADIEYFTDSTSEVIEAADCCLMVSGSISLELLARGTPGVVFYRVGRVGRFFSRFLMNCRYITLTNLIAGREVMPEFIISGDPAPAVHAASEILTRWLNQPADLRSVRMDMESLAAEVAQPGASDRAARCVLSCLNIPVAEQSPEQSSGRAA